MSNGVDYFTDQMINKEVEQFIEDLNFWFDKVFLHQNGKPQNEAEYFIRQLSKRLNNELECMIWDRKLDRKG